MFLVMLLACWRYNSGLNPLRKYSLIDNNSENML